MTYEINKLCGIK